MIDLTLFSECFCNESRSDQSKDQRIQNDKVGGAMFHLGFSLTRFIFFLYI